MIGYTGMNNSALFREAHALTKATIKREKPTQKQVADKAQKLANKIIKDQLVSDYSEEFNPLYEEI